MLIRQLSLGKRSLDDLVRAFLGGESAGPRVPTYGFDDVEAARNTRADLVTYYLDSDRAGMEMAQAFLTEVDAFFAPVSASAPGQ